MDKKEHPPQGPLSSGGGGRTSHFLPLKAGISTLNALWGNFLEACFKTRQGLEFSEVAPEVCPVVHTLFPVLTSQEPLQDHFHKELGSIVTAAILYSRAQALPSSRLNR